MIANDPAFSGHDEACNVYKREQFETIWLRTKEYIASGNVAGGSGGIAYILTPNWRHAPQMAHTLLIGAW